MTEILEGRNASRLAQFKRWWLHAPDGYLAGWVRVCIGVPVLGLIGVLFYDIISSRPHPTPLSFWALVIMVPLRLIVVDKDTRLPSAFVDHDAYRAAPLKLAGLIAYRWWFAKASWVHVIIVWATAWAVQIIIQASPPPLVKAGALFLVALIFIVLWRVDWVAYIGNTPHRLREAWQKSWMQFLTSVVTGAAAYVFWYGQAIPLISWMNGLMMDIMAVCFAGFAAIFGVISLITAIGLLLFGQGPSNQANPTDVVANQNRDRDADFARVGDVDQALRGWTDYPPEKFED